MFLEDVARLPLRGGENLVSSHPGARFRVDRLWRNDYVPEIRSFVC